MALYVCVAAGSVLLASMVKNKDVIPSSRQQYINRGCLMLIFAILFILSALRLNVGNDYAKYVEFMHLVNCDSYVPTEIGFNLLVKIIFFLSGYENYLLVFAIYAFFTILFFMLAMYEQSDDFAFSFFLFMALGYYFQTFSTVRYYLALAIALYSMKFVLNRQWVKFILIVLLGATFHKSLLVIIPLYFLAQLKWKKWMIIVAGLFCSTFFFLQDFYLKVVVFLYPSYEDTEYLSGGTSLINILRCAAVFALSLICYKKCIQGNRRNSFYFYLNLGALVLYTCCSFLPVISRIGYYLSVCQIFFIPVLVESIDNYRIRRIMRAGVILAALLYFGMYLSKAASDGVRILPYETFLFHDMVPILSDTGYW